MLSGYPVRFLVSCLLRLCSVRVSISSPHPSQNKQSSLIAPQIGGFRSLPLDWRTVPLDGWSSGEAMGNPIRVWGLQRSCLPVGSVREGVRLRRGKGRGKSRGNSSAARGLQDGGTEGSDSWGTRWGARREYCDAREGES